MRRRDHLNHGAAEDNGWSQGLPDMVEEVLVNVLPQEDALRLRLVSSHWARYLLTAQRSIGRRYTDDGSTFARFSP